jgi:tRNA modification GTPase
MYPLDDTIAAIASAPGGAARGIVRLSGPKALECTAAVFRANDGEPICTPPYPKATGGSLSLNAIYSPLPCDLYLWPKGRSYTGQIVAEFHTLGSPPLLDALVKSLCRAGARIAEPGEFTLRAFLSGRVDLTQAEAVLGVIDAANPRELQVAIAQLAGGLAGPLNKFRDMLLELLAHLEAGFDFADEDLPFITAEELERRLNQAAAEVRRLADQMQSRGTSQTAVRAVLFGQPNTGKSSLFNALTRKEHALVSELPGTTRDYLVAELDFGGRKCQLIDTAGVKHMPTASVGTAPDNIINTPDQAAQAAAAEQIQRAQVRLLCLDAARPPDAWELDEIAKGHANDEARHSCLPVTRQIVVWTKIDAVGTNAKPTDSCKPLTQRQPVAFTSSATGQGLDELREELRKAVEGVDTSQGDFVASTAARCQESLRCAGEGLQNALELVRQKSGEELIAAEIRAALDELGEVVGAVYTEDVLERIFSRFCVGK